MANEFIARKGLIVPTGSINVIDGDVTASNFLGTASVAISSSFATTASFALSTTAGQGFPFSGSAVITGSLDVTQAMTASFFKGDGSQLTNIDVGASVVTDTYKFVGDGATQLYILSQSYLKDNLRISVDGLTFTPDIDFTYTTGSIEFTEAPPSSSNILVNALLNAQNNLTGSYTGSFIGDGRGLTNLPSAVTIDTYEFIANGITTNYQLDHLYTLNSLFVSVDGLIFASSSDFILSSSTLQFTSAPPSESVILIKAFVNTGNEVTGSFSGSFFGIIASASYAETASFATTASYVNISIVADNHLFVGDGTTINYTLSQSYSPEILTVSTDGLVNALTEDYTVSGTQLSFIIAPPSSSNVLVKGIKLSIG
jgi:hypothetical protein